MGNVSLVMLGAFVVALVAFLSASLAPSPVAPASFFGVLPALWLSLAMGDRTFAGGLYLIPAVAAAVYLVASIPVLFMRTWAWKACVAMFAMFGLADVTFLAVTWTDGVHYQGASYSWLVVLLNVVCVLVVTTLLVFAWRSKSSTWLGCAHVAMFCWLNWVAFPWFGEMP